MTDKGLKLSAAYVGLGLLLGAALYLERAEAQEPTYSRSAFRHWTDDDRDCQDSRAETLIRDSLVAVTFRPHPTGRRCVVDAGVWLDPYAGRFHYRASDVDVDHLVPLKAAWDAGASAWGPDRRESYANHWTHGKHLVAVEDGVNAAKGARGPDAWRPPLVEAWCWYATAWRAVKGEWHLAVDYEEERALQEMEATCPTS